MKNLHERRELVERGHPELSLVQQCLLLGLHRSGIYYQLKNESELNEELMRKMNAHYLEHPYMGAQRMHIWLTCDLDYKVNWNQVDSLYYEVMGLRIILSRPQSKPKSIPGITICYPDWTSSTSIKCGQPTMSSLSGFGAASSTNMYICTPRKI
ncbi:MAG: hypothetical protein R2795_11510 [Saprospiraceae bacterium]